MKSPVIWVPYENYMWQIFLNFWGVGWGDVASGQYCREGIIFNFLFFFWLGGSLRRGGNATVASGQYCGQGIMCNYLFIFLVGGWLRRRGIGAILRAGLEFLRVTNTIYAWVGRILWHSKEYWKLKNGFALCFIFTVHYVYTFLLQK